MGTCALLRQEERSLVGGGEQPLRFRTHKTQGAEGLVGASGCARDQLDSGVDAQQSSSLLEVTGGQFGEDQIEIAGSVLRVLLRNLQWGQKARE